jgi:single-stranded DNA-binding protein
VTSREWDDKQGEKHTSFEIVLSEMRFLSTGESAQEPAPHHKWPTTGSAAPTQEMVTAPEISDEDIPF